MHYKAYNRSQNTWHLYNQSNWQETNTINPSQLNVQSHHKGLTIKCNGLFVFIKWTISTCVYTPFQTRTNSN